MLGKVESSRNWQWAAYGKHPAAKDYFRLGQQGPLVSGFSDWVEKGYQIWTSRGNTRPHFRSWRFWARGGEKENVVCGVVRESHDGVGRPYPLLIVGTGTLKGWKDEWDLLPLACEKTWNQIEYLASKSFAGTKQMEDEVYSLQSPSPQWPEFWPRRESLSKMGSASPSPTSNWDASTLAKQALSFTEKDELFIVLDSGPGSDPFTQACLWHVLFKDKVQAPPNATFMGGTLEKTYLAFYKRALLPADFLQLWSGSSIAEGENGSLVAG